MEGLERSFRFVSLPIELRYKIYEEALDIDSIDELNDEDESQNEPRGHRRPTLAIALFRANRAINHEATHFFYSRNLFVRFMVCYDELPAPTPFRDYKRGSWLARPTEALKNSKHHAMDVQITVSRSRVCRIMIMLTHHHLFTVVKQMRLFTYRSRDVAWKTRVHMELRKRYGLGSDFLQQRLLDPFRQLNGYPQAVAKQAIIGLDRARELTTHIRGNRFDCGQWLQDILTLWSSGGILLEQGSPSKIAEGTANLELFVGIALIAYNTSSRHRKRFVAMDQRPIPEHLRELVKELSAPNTTDEQDPQRWFSKTVRRLLFYAFNELVDQYCIEQGSVRAETKIRRIVGEQIIPFCVDLPSSRFPGLANDMSWYGNIERALACRRTGLYFEQLGDAVHLRVADTLMQTADRMFADLGVPQD
ncbi:MAG: hypothetical protein M1820_004469 [Bogoriella megaspora]|nr:MAG: hypothetical protein M1820_004469 [Bogoriella megaspora]